MKTSKTGKHGHAKCNITGISVINGKKYTDIKPAHAATWIVNTNKQELTVRAVPWPCVLVVLFVCVV